MKKFYLLFMALMLTARAALAVCATDTVVVLVSPCKSSQNFTIRIPVRLPAGITAEYEWYRNGWAISGTRHAGFGGGIIAYTIPANSIVSAGQEFYFLFRLSDDNCDDCWDSSPLYMISYRDSFADISCKISGGAIVGSALDLCSADAAGKIRGSVVHRCDALSGGIVHGEAVQHCGANAGGKIYGATVQHCNANAAGEIRGSAVQHCGASAGGRIGKN